MNKKPNCILHRALLFSYPLCTDTLHNPCNNFLILLYANYLFLAVGSPLYIILKGQRLYFAPYDLDLELEPCDSEELCLCEVLPLNTTNTDDTQVSYSIYIF